LLFLAGRCDRYEPPETAGWLTKQSNERTRLGRWRVWLASFESLNDSADPARTFNEPLCRLDRQS
jgi:hypothetical protein